MNLLSAVLVLLSIPGHVKTMQIRSASTTFPCTTISWWHGKARHSVPSAVALHTREDRNVGVKGAIYPRRALCTREGRYVPVKGAMYP